MAGLIPPYCALHILLFKSVVKLQEIVLNFSSCHTSQLTAQAHYCEESSLNFVHIIYEENHLKFDRA